MSTTPNKTAEAVELEEALRLAEIGEYLYETKTFSAGNGYDEPREYSISWDWQQSKPNEYGQGVLLAEAVAWHHERAEDGIETEAAKLRKALTHAQQSDARVREALEEARDLLLERIHGNPARSAGHNAQGEVIPMILHCPACGVQHIDEPDEATGWTNPPHRSHLCLSCGHVWRPADVATTGVAAIQTRGKADSPASPAPSRVVEEVIVKPDDLQDLLVAAYEDGAHATHKHYQPGPDPCFKEAAYDYVAGLDFTAITRPLRASSSPPDAQDRIEALEKALEPFADCGEMLASETSGFQSHDELVLFTDDSEPHSQRCELTRFKFGDFRRARAALQPGGDHGG